MTENKECKIILDTNLWISWLITKEFKKLDQLITDKRNKLIFSQELIEEFIEVANRPKLKKYFKKNDLRDLLEIIDEYAIFIKVKSKVNACRDPKDNFILSLAKDSMANFIITGDKDLLALRSYKDTRIITLDEFFE